MNNTTASNLPPVPPGELEIFVGQVTVLHTHGIPSVPLCRALPDGNCTAHWHPRPCGDAGKRPVPTGYRLMAEELPPLDHLLDLVRKFFPCNIGIVVPERLAVIEGDSPEGEAELVRLGGDAIDHAPARERREGRGRGWLFRVAPERDVPHRVHRGASKAIDVLSGGSIFVVPPSVHRTGHCYHWVPGRAPWEVVTPILPPELYELAMDGARSHGDSQVDLPTGVFTPRVSSRVAFLLASRSDLERLWNGEGKRHGDNSHSGVDYTVAVLLDIAGVPLNEIAEALAARPGAHRADRSYCYRTALAASRRER